MCGTRSEQEESVTVAFAYSMFSDDVVPGMAVGADTCVEVAEHDELLKQFLLK